MPSTTYGKWLATDYTWAENPFKWSDIAFVTEIVTEVAGAGGSVAEAILQQSKNYSTEKRKKLIKLVCIVNNIEYIDSKFTNDEIKITAKDIEVLLEAVQQIKLRINIK